MQISLDFLRSISRSIRRGSFLWRLPKYILLLVTLALAMLMRAATKADAMVLIGPTLGCAGFSMLLSLTAQTVSLDALIGLEDEAVEAVLAAVARGSVVVERTATNKLRAICLCLALPVLALWAWSLWLSLAYPTVNWWIVPAHSVPGTLGWVVGLAMSELKEVVL